MHLFVIYRVGPCCSSVRLGQTTLAHPRVCTVDVCDNWFWKECVLNIVIWIDMHE